MSKFKSWIRNWIMRDDAEVKLTAEPRIREVEYDESQTLQTLRFSVTPARGGLILSVRHYDRRKDESNFVNHVIHDDQNVAENIAQIVSMEILRSN